MREIFRLRIEKPSAAGSGYQIEDLGVTCIHPQPLSHSGYPSGILSLPVLNFYADEQEDEALCGGG